MSLKESPSKVFFFRKKRFNINFQKHNLKKSNGKVHCITYYTNETYKEKSDLNQFMHAYKHKEVCIEVYILVRNPPQVQ